MLRHLGVKDRAIEFVRSKPADEVYYWTHSNICACGQFLAENRDIGETVKGGPWATSEIREMNELARDGGWTFGQLLARMEAKWPLHV